MTGETKMKERLFVAWSACEKCFESYCETPQIGYDKITKKWYHLEKSFCGQEPSPMEVMV